MIGKKFKIKRHLKQFHLWLTKKDAEKLLKIVRDYASVSDYFRTKIREEKLKEG